MNHLHCCFLCTGKIFFYFFFFLQIHQYWLAASSFDINLLCCFIKSVYNLTGNHSSIRIQDNSCNILTIFLALHEIEKAAINHQLVHGIHFPFLPSISNPLVPNLITLPPFVDFMQLALLTIWSYISANFD